MQIGNIKLKNNLFLAPMAGITDKAFRIITKPYGPALMYTEMVSGKGLHYNSKKTESLLDVAESEKPISAQIFGHDPEIMGEIAEGALRHGAEMIDINMGCPAPKIVNNGDGSALMKNPILAGQVIESVRRSVNVPVTVKFRMGWDEHSINAVDFAKIAEESGADAITIHGRTRKAFYSGAVNLDIIKKVKRAVSIPVIGNGDITDAVSAKKMLDETGCNGIMVGRGAQGNPWIFSEISEYLESGRIVSPPSLTERVNKALEHLNLLIEFKGERRGILEGRKHMAQYFKGIKGGAKIRDIINKACSQDEMKYIIEMILKEE